MRWSGKRWIGLGAACLGAAVTVGLGVHFIDPDKAPAPPVARTAQPAAADNRGPADTIPDEAQAPSVLQIDDAARLVGEARRLAADGKFVEARAALDKADKLNPGQPETAQARRDVEQMSTPQGQFTLYVERAQAAIGHDDRAAAEQALAAAERLQPQAPEIARLRQALGEAERKQARRSQQIAELLATMRQAIARHDLAAADRALNEAARLDVYDPTLDGARRELAHAQDDERRRDAQR